MNKVTGCWLSSVFAVLLVTALSVIAQDHASDPDLAAKSPLYVEPSTIEGRFEAALLMLNLARPELARGYLEQLLAEGPSDDDLLAVRKKHGTSAFLELAGVEALNPPASQLLDRLTAAVRSQAGQSGYVESLLPGLLGTPRQRAQTIMELQHLGSQAVPGILSNLRSKQGIDRDALTVSLSRLGRDAVGPLVGALRAPDDEIRAIAADALGVVGSRSETIWLWHPAFAEGQSPGTQRAARRALARLKYGDAALVSKVSVNGAAQQLLETATEFLSGQYRSPEIDGDVATVSVWTWDDALGTVREHVVDRRRAGVFSGERLARESADLSPSRDDAAVVVLASLFEREMEEAGWSRTAPTGPGTASDLALSSGPEMCERLLRFALDHNLVAAAVGSLQALALNGSTNLLRGSPPDRAVIAALDAPSPRVQFAAAVAILQWEPREGFRSATRVVEILARALNAEPRPASVVMDPNVPRGTSTGAVFGELGFQPSFARTGREGFELAANRGNVELAVLHPNVIRWELTQTVANLRADARTANMPVVIYGPAEIRNRTNHITAAYPSVLFIDETDSSGSIGRDLRPLLAQLSPPPLTQQQRGQEIADAVFWLRQIAVRNLGRTFDLTLAEDALTKAVNEPAVANDALIALGGIEKPSVQATLARTAVSRAMSTEVRELAAAQLAFHIQQHSSLLLQRDVDALLSAWSSESEPKIHTALGSVIGSLKPNQSAVRKEILTRPMSAAPAGSM